MAETKEKKAPVSEHYKAYDEFEARILKKTIVNPYTQQNSTFITGWELGKKLRVTSIEPGVAKDLNAFANGFDNQTGDGGRGKILLLKDQYKNGDILQYEDWAKEQELDLKKDINIILAKADKE
jgi:hypothetical protein